MYIPYSDNSADCSYHRDKPPETSVYVIVIVTSLAVAFIILILVSLLYLLYCRHGKKSTSFVELDQLNNENDHYDNTVNEPTVQPAQEAGSYSDQLQVGLATPTESSQSHCSKSTTEESLKYMEQHYSIPWTVAGKQKSSLVGLRSNLFETVT